MTNASQKTASARIVAIAAALIAVALIATMIVMQPWKKSDDAGAAQPPAAVRTGAVTGADPTPTAAPSAPAEGEDDGLLAKEAKVAAAHGWQVGRDFAGLVPHDFTRNMVLKLARPAADSPYAMGSNPKAPVVVRIFSDFSCPICTRMHAESMPMLEKLAKEGKIVLEWNNFVIFPNYGSDKAALASMAAAKQGKLWDFIDAAYGQAAPGDHPTYTDESVIKVAEKAGVPDMAAFEKDYHSPELKKEFEDDQARVRSLGFSGTPTMLIGGAYVNGLVSNTILQNTIVVENEVLGK